MLLSALKKMPLPGRGCTKPSMDGKDVTPRIRYARCLPVIHRSCHVICLRVALCHVIIFISCACFSKLASVRVPPVLSVVRSEPDHTRKHPSPLPVLVLWSTKKRSRNGPIFVKCPWYITGRPPVKFHSIWRSFDAPMFNRVAAKASFVCSPTPLQSGP